VKPITELNPDRSSAQDFCRDRIRHFEAKADHNKAEALRVFVTLISCALASPLFITLGQGTILGKVVPSVLSSVAAGCAIWLQQRKPQQLWTLYRTTQRRLENEEIGFRFAINQYEEANDPEKLLAQRTALMCMTANDLWAPLVPNPDKVIGIAGIEGAGPARNQDHSLPSGHR
jgi:hypothetical protein